MRDARYIEKQIDNFTYPAKLPNAQKRLIAAKIQELEQGVSDERLQLERALSSVSRQTETPIGKLPVKARNVAKKIVQTRADLVKLQARLKSLGVDGLGTLNIFFMSSTEAEYTQRRQDIQDKITALTKRSQEGQEQIRDIARGLAVAQVAALKAKIAATSPELVAKLDAIGHPLGLPAVSVETIDEQPGVGDE